jgi:hypothetical protein
MTREEAKWFLLGCQANRMGKTQSDSPFPVTGQPDKNRRAWDRGWWGYRLYRMRPTVYPNPEQSDAVPPAMRPVARREK